MPLTPGTRVGPYEILEAIGAGGMGEVYRARDTKLGRDVAIKALPDLLSDASDRLNRFEREAQILAALNHPHIATIHGVVESAGSSFIVLELVNGESLADHLRDGALPLTEALSIGRQIADALQAAHLKGIVHRDLKPGNVMLTSDGRVKVLDFGLAKIAEPAAQGAQGIHPVTPASPTFTSPATQLGIILGTAAYMAPEQARGKPVDKRADVWAFGCVLYEMLSGRRPFDGEDVTETISAVLRSEPDWTRLPAALSPTLQRFLRKCFEKSPNDRVQDVGDMRLAMDGAFDVPAVPLASAAPRPRLAWAAGAVLAAIAIAAITIALLASKVRAPASADVRRLSILPAAGSTPYFDAAENALSPDGRFLVYRAGSTQEDSQLWLRALDATAPRLLQGTQGALQPFWSPDSRRVGFFAKGKLRTITIDSGAVGVVCDAPNARGGTWGEAGVIVFAPSGAGPLMRVPADGGEPSAVTALDASRQESAHRFPYFLPDGRHFLFAALPRREGKFDIYLASIDRPDRTLLLSAATAPVYAEPGYLLFMHGSTLAAQPFDARQLKITGEPIALRDVPGGVNAEWVGGRAVSVSRDGALAYFGGAVQASKFAWIDPSSGREVGDVEAPPGLYNQVEISPDGKRAAVVRDDPPLGDIWILELERGGATRLTNGNGRNTRPVWSPDGKRIAFVSDRSGQTEIYIKDADGNTPEQLALGSQLQFIDLTSWSPDGKYLVFSAIDRDTQQDLWLLPLDGDRKPIPYLRTQYVEIGAAVSPDGKYLAYASNETGRLEIFVQTFPKAGDKYQVSNGSAISATWLPGNRIAYVKPSLQEVMVADIIPGATFRTGPARHLTTLPPDVLSGAPLPDISKILVSIPADRHPAVTLTVVLNWTAALRPNP